MENVVDVGVAYPKLSKLKNYVRRGYPNDFFEGEVFRNVVSKGLGVGRGKAQ